MVRDGQIVGSMEGQAAVGEVDCSTTTVRGWVDGWKQREEGCAVHTAVAWSPSSVCGMAQVAVTGGLAVKDAS